MKKIGILTITNIYNYGTKLQAYAMQEIFRQRGFQTEIIQFSERNSLFADIKYGIEKLNIVKQIFYNRYIKKQYGVNINRRVLMLLKSRLKSLDSFDNNYKRKIITNRISLIEYTKKFDCIVCGSDQIWHPCAKRLDLWTLSLVADGVRRISYAPSLGVEIMPKEAKSYFKYAFEKIDSISVRESNAVGMLQDLTTKKIHVVLDPTLLVGRAVWDKILTDRIELTSKQYCLCYLLGTNLEHRRIIAKTANILGMPIYNFAHFKRYNDADEDLEGKKLYDISPSDFIGLVKNAKYVITDSFHCTVFSILYHVPFMTLLRYDSSDKMSTNSRLYSFLGELNLDSRIYTQEKNLETLVYSNIDFESVEQILTQKRIESNNFLNDALVGL